MPSKSSAPASAAGRTTPTRRSPAVILGLLILLAAAAWPTAVAAHGDTANGCTGVPDRGPGFDFHDICDRHDHCYRFRPHGDSRAARKLCDRTFLDEMRDHCKDRRLRHRIPCEIVAYTYYAGVRTLGSTYWAKGEASSLG